MFGGERADALSYAAVTVSIPPNRQVGQVQWPAALPGDPKRDFVTVSADYIDQQDFRRLDRRDRPQDQKSTGSDLRSRIQQPLRRCGVPVRPDRARF